MLVTMSDSQDTLDYTSYGDGRMRTLRTHVIPCVRLQGRMLERILTMNASLQSELVFLFVLARLP